jgi:ligand-binding sensor domain-containing protein
MIEEMSRRRLLLALAVTGAGVLIFGASVVWRAQNTLTVMRERVATEGILKVSAKPFSPTLQPSLEVIGAPASFTDAQIFQGHLFLAGPSGLTEYSPSLDLIKRYRVGIELPPAPVTALATGIAGSGPVMWIATAGEGLIEFDGQTLHQILPDDTRFHKLTALLPLSTGRVLLGTEKAGVLSWNGHQMTPFHPSLQGLQVTALTGDDSSVWVGTLDRGLIHWNAGGLETIADPLPDHQVLSLAMTGQTVYAGTGLGIAEFQGGKFSRILAQGYFAQSLLAQDGKLWMGTLEEGMREVPLESRAGRAAPLTWTGCPNCSVRKILRVEGETYSVTDTGLWKGSQQVIGRENGILKDRNIAALSTDSTGRLWIGYFDRGLQILDPATQRSVEDLEDDHLFCVNRIAQDPVHGATAVATANGLVLFSSATSQRRVIGQTDGLIANQVTDVLFRSDGSMVAATPAGVSFLDSSGISSIYAFQGLVNNHVYSLAADGTRILAGTLGGLSVLDSGLVKASYTTSNSALKHNWITAIARRGNGYFVGTYGAGVLRFDDSGGWQSFDDLRGPLDINTNAMVSTPNAVYAGTLDRGLAIYNPAKERWSFFTSGLPSKNVTALEARGGILYIGTDNGLVKVPEASILQ